MKASMPVFDIVYIAQKKLNCNNIFVDGVSHIAKMFLLLLYSWHIYGPLKN